MNSQNRYEKYIKKSNLHQAVGVLYLFFTAFYIYWLTQNLNYKVPWISIPFLLFQLFSFMIMIVSIINTWKGVYRTKRPLLPQKLPTVAVVVCTYNEPVKVVKKTITSLLNLTYKGRVVILLSNDSRDHETRRGLTKLMGKMASYWNENNLEEKYDRSLFYIDTEPHKDAKAGNLNQTLKFLKNHFPEIDLLLTQDADEVCYPEMLDATVGYFEDTRVAYVQTVKQSLVSRSDPFGNRDLLWYCRIAPSRDASNSMFACGSGVMWRISALATIGGFSTWNLVEDLRTSYELLAKGWQGRYHYEALSEGLAPEDLPNFIKQRGTWAMDHLRIFFWDNPLIKRGLSVWQRLQFVEPSLFYLNGFFNLILLGVTALSLLFAVWPTTVDALTHAKYLLPSFLMLEAYYLLLAEGIPFTRERQFWIGLSPVFAIAALKVVWYGPKNKPVYKVTRKENLYGNYISLVLPQLVTLSIISIALIRILVSTPLYSAFDWAAVFWGFYQASFFVQSIKVSWWRWNPTISIELVSGNIGNAVRRAYLFARLKLLGSSY